MKWKAPTRSTAAIERDRSAAAEKRNRKMQERLERASGFAPIKPTPRPDPGFREDADIISRAAQRRAMKRARKK